MPPPFLAFSVPSPFLRLILARSGVVWIGIRLTLLLIFKVYLFNVPAALMIAGVAALVATLDGRRRNEHLFLANVGVPPGVLFAMAWLPGLAGEIAVRWLT